MISIDGHKITPTIFPDKTSQVWKLDEKVLDAIRRQTENVEICWDFENEAELVHCLQLACIVRKENPNASFSLYMPYLPYARQDKDISNDETFALLPFLSLLVYVFPKIKVFDPHSRDMLDYVYGSDCTIEQPEEEINYAIEETDATMICYPDKGAAQRYPFLSRMPCVTMDKVRDQSTGEITGMVCDKPETVLYQNVLIVDDMCDGGRTFREAAKILYAAGANDVNLYVSHGIFSHPEGVGILYQEGISKVFTKDGVAYDKPQAVFL